MCTNQLCAISTQRLSQKQSTYLFADSGSWDLDTLWSSQSFLSDSLVLREGRLSLFICPLLLVIHVLWKTDRHVSETLKQRFRIRITHFWNHIHLNQVHEALHATSSVWSQPAGQVNQHLSPLSKQTPSLRFYQATDLWCSPPLSDCLLYSLTEEFQSDFRVKQQRRHWLNLKRTFC